MQRTQMPHGTEQQHAPWLATVAVISSIFSDAGKTPGGVRQDVFKADDRINSRGETIKGNGLAEYGAIIRRGRKVLIDVRRYGDWLAGKPLAKNCGKPLAKNCGKPLAKNCGKPLANG